MACEMPQYFQNLRHERTERYPFASRIIWERTPGTPLPPPELNDLAYGIDKTQRSLRTIYLEARNDPSTFQERFEELFRIAAIGLRGNDPNVEAAKRDLELLQGDVLRDGNQIRSINLSNYMRIGLKIIIPCLIVATLLDLLWHSNFLPGAIPEYFTSHKYTQAIQTINENRPITDANRTAVEEAQRTAENELEAAEGLYKRTLALIAAIFWIPVGAAFGNLILFVARSAELTLDTIVVVDEFRWRPRESYIVVILFGIGLGAVLAFQILQLGIFGILLNDFMKLEPAISVLAGFSTAVGFTVVREILLSLRVSKRE
jgi:hypothetical protein